MDQSFVWILNLLSPLRRSRPYCPPRYSPIPRRWASISRCPPTRRRSGSSSWATSWRDGARPGEIWTGAACTQRRNRDARYTWSTSGRNTCGPFAACKNSRNNSSSVIPGSLRYISMRNRFLDIFPEDYLYHQDHLRLFLLFCKNTFFLYSFYFW